MDKDSDQLTKKGVNQMKKQSEFKDLSGKTLIDIKGGIGDKEMIFTDTDNKKYRLFHDRDCCESVTIEDIIGDIEDLIGQPILMSEEIIYPHNQAPENVKMSEIEDIDSFTWTFYKLATIKGSVTIRWYGESNGYYSEKVDFETEPFTCY